MNTKNYKDSDSITLYRSISKEEYELFKSNSLELRFTNWSLTHKSDAIGYCYFTESPEVLDVLKANFHRWKILVIVISKRKLDSKRFKTSFGYGYGYHDDTENQWISVDLQEISTTSPILAEECRSYSLINNEDL